MRHFPVPVQYLLIGIALRRGTILESLQKVFETRSRLTVSHQHLK